MTQAPQIDAKPKAGESTCARCADPAFGQAFRHADELLTVRAENARRKFEAAHARAQTTGSSADRDEARHQHDEMKTALIARLALRDAVTLAMEIA